MFTRVRTADEIGYNLDDEEKRVVNGATRLGFTFKRRFCRSLVFEKELDDGMHFGAAYNEEKRIYSVGLGFKTDPDNYPGNTLDFWRDVDTRLRKEGLENKARQIAREAEKDWGIPEGVCVASPHLSAMVTGVYSEGEDISIVYENIRKAAHALGIDV